MERLNAGPAATKAVPAVRFTAEEQGQLQPLATRAYVPLIPGPSESPASPRPRVTVPVERRALAAYAALLGEEVV